MMRLRLQMLRPVFDKVQLKVANVLGGRRVGGAFEKCRESLAAIDVAALRAAPSLRASMSSIMRWRSELTAIRAHGELLLG